MKKAKVYNGIESSITVVEAEKGKVVFLEDVDIRKLLLRKKVKVTIEGNGEEISLVYLQGNQIEKKNVTSSGPKGYYHIPVGPLGDDVLTAFVVPADKKKSEASASAKAEQGDDQNENRN